MRNKVEPKFTLLVADMPLAQYPIKSPFAMPAPIGITIHETDNNASARNEVAYMQRNSNLLSFHFAVDENEIIQCAPLDRNTWHAADGNGNGNRATISIEIARNYRTDNLTNYYKARANAELLTGWLMYVYNFDIEDIYTHKQWSGKNCPRVILREGYLNTFKANAAKVKNTYAALPSKPVEKPNTTTSKLAVGQIVKIEDSAAKYANVNIAIPSWVKKQNHTILTVDEPNKRVLLKEINSWVLMNDIEGYQKQAEQTKIKVGDMVKVRQGAKSYDGALVVNDWYTTPKRVDQLSGNRAVLDINRWVTPFNVNDLVLATAASKPSTSTSTGTSTIKVGSRVRAIGGVYGTSYGGSYGGEKNITGIITYTNVGAPRPYHVGTIGWFAAKDVTLLGGSAAYKVGDTVYVKGTLYADSTGRGAGQTINQKGKITHIATGAAKPYHIDGLGWVAAKDVS